MRRPTGARRYNDMITLMRADSVVDGYGHMSVGEPVKVIIADTTIGRVGEAAACADKFRKAGVDITLTTAEASHLRGQGYDVYEGVNHMDGATALAHARNRTTGYDGDFSRTNRQRAVLEALFVKASTLDVTSLKGLVDVMIPMVVTDMSNTEIISAATTLAPIMSELELVSQRIPADGTYEMAMIDGMSVLLPDFDANHKLLQETIGDN